MAPLDMDFCNSVLPLIDRAFGGLGTNCWGHNSVADNPCGSENAVDIELAPLAVAEKGRVCIELHPFLH